MNQQRAQSLVENTYFERFIIGVIVINAITLGLETSQALMDAYGPILVGIDTVAVLVFIAELFLKLSAYRSRYFASGWNIFDFTILMATLVPYVGIPGMGNLTVLRAFRILRALRLLTAVPEFRNVLGTLAHSLRGVGAVAGVFSVVLYITGVLAVKLFGTISPEHFGTLGASLLSLFTIITLEGWREIADPIATVLPFAHFFFVSFILIGAFVLFNLLITVLMAAGERQQEEERRSRQASLDQIDERLDELQQILEQLLEQRRNSK